jgi:hypothetical protein
MAGITPWTVGNLAPAWTISLIPDSGSVTMTGLTTSNFSLRIRNNNTGVETTGAGAFSNITAASGATPASVTYQPAAADVGTVAPFTLWVDITFSNGVESFLIGLFQVVPE